MNTVRCLYYEHLLNMRTVGSHTRTFLTNPTVAGIQFCPLTPSRIVCFTNFYAICKNNLRNLSVINWEVLLVGSEVRKYNHANLAGEIADN